MIHYQDLKNEISLKNCDKEIKSSIHLRPQKTSEQKISKEYKTIPEEVDYNSSKYEQNLTQVENFDEKNASLTNLARKRPERPPLPSKKDYSEYFQYFTVKEKTPSVLASSPDDEKIISSSLVRETSSIRRRKKKVKRRRSLRNLQETNDHDIEYYQPYEPENFEKATEDEFAYEDRPIGESPDDVAEEESEDEAHIELHVESDDSQIDRFSGYHYCKDQYSDEYASVPIEPRRNLRETFSQIFQKTRNLQNLRSNISSLGIYAQPKGWFKITQARKICLNLLKHANSDSTSVTILRLKGNRTRLYETVGAPPLGYCQRSWSVLY